MVKKTRDRLRKECREDLNEARRQGHAAWIATLTTRLAWLDRLAVDNDPAADTCLIVEPKEAA